MATTIHLNFGTLAFSSAVERISVRTAAASVNVSLYAVDTSGSETAVFAETYYPYSENVTLHDFASIIEDEMAITGSPLQKFRIEAEASDDTSDDKTFTILYCSCHTSCQPSGIVASQFLTTRKVIEATADYPLPLFYVRPPVEYLDQELVSFHVICRRQDTGDVRIIFVPNGHTGYGKDYELKMLTISREWLAAQTASSFPNIPYDIIGVTVRIGQRSITVYYTKRKPDIRLYFTNMFNALEIAELVGDTTAKTKVKRTEAVCDGIVSFYDQSVEQSFEFQTAGLTAEYAEWLGQLFMSRDVRIINKPYHEEDNLNEPYPSVLITDSTCEVQDGDEELNTVKFTYRYTSDRPESSVALPDRIHTDTFKTPFS